MFQVVMLYLGMKNLLLILLFVPFTSIGQDMTYKDLMGFENKIQVERFLIEHNYERFDYDNEENIKLWAQENGLKKEK